MLHTAPLTTRTAPSFKPFPWHLPCEYDEAQKLAFHRAAAKSLKALADYLGWEKSSYRLSSNKAGPAVSGEITLHHERVYIQVSQSMGADHGILLRSCNGKRDYTGGPNGYAALSLLNDIPALADRLMPLLSA